MLTSWPEAFKFRSCITRIYVFFLNTYPFGSFSAERFIFIHKFLSFPFKNWCFINVLFMHGGIPENIPLSLTSLKWGLPPLWKFFWGPGFSRFIAELESFSLRGATGEKDFPTFRDPELERFSCYMTELRPPDNSIIFKRWRLKLLSVFPRTREFPDDLLDVYASYAFV